MLKRVEGEIEREAVDEGYSSRELENPENKLRK